MEKVLSFIILGITIILFIAYIIVLISRNKKGSCTRICKNQIMSFLVVFLIVSIIAMIIAHFLDAKKFKIIICILGYYLFVFISKAIFGGLARRENVTIKKIVDENTNTENSSNKNENNNCVCILEYLKKVLMFFISIDYLATDVFKKHLENSDEIEIIKNEKSNDSLENNSSLIDIKESQKKRRSNLITTYNHINLFLSIFLFEIILIAFIFKWECSIQEILIIICTIRIISRSVEIIISFVKDINEKNKNSNLQKSERAKLCFLSIFEVFVLLISINLLAICCKNNDFEGLLDVLITALKGIMGNDDSVECACACACNKDTYDILQKIIELDNVSCHLTFYSLIGIVITNYLSSEK